MKAGAASASAAARSLAAFFRSLRLRGFEAVARLALARALRRIESTLQKRNIGKTEKSCNYFDSVSNNLSGGKPNISIIQKKRRFDGKAEEV